MMFAPSLISWVMTWATCGPSGTFSLYIVYDAAAEDSLARQASDVMGVRPARVARRAHIDERRLERMAGRPLAAGGGSRGGRRCRDRGGGRRGRSGRRRHRCRRGAARGQQRRDYPEHDGQPDCSPGSVHRAPPCLPKVVPSPRCDSLAHRDHADRANPRIAATRAGSPRPGVGPSSATGCRRGAGWPRFFVSST